MAPTTLTPVQRLQLINQFRILENLYPDEAEFFEHKRDIVAHGYTLEYEDVFSEVFEEMSIDECKYVYDVLDMHRAMLASYEALSDKEGLTLDEILFKGFDGNNEIKRYAFVQHLKKQGRWKEILSNDLNSHSMSTISRYPEMLGKYTVILDQIKESSPIGKRLLTASQIKAVIA